MSVGLYVAYTGAVAAQDQLDVIANNVANASTTGFRRDQTIFDTVLAAAMPFVQVGSGQLDLSPGSHQLTKNPLHAAIDGDGFFVVEDPQGREVYTRRGDFRVNAQGQLVLPGGLAVLGQGGALTIPPGTSADLRGDGTLMTPDGPIGRLRLVRFAEPSELYKIGGNLIASGPAAGPEDVENVRVSVGFVERSNVNLAAEMVALIQVTRAFEASIQSIRINDTLTQRLIQAQNG